MKKFFLSIFMVIFSFFITTDTVLAENPVNIYLFYGETCPVCHKEKAFLEEIKKEYSNVVIYEYEVWNNNDNHLLMVEVGELFNRRLEGSVPFTVVGEKSFFGYTEAISYQIEASVKTYSEYSYEDKTGVLLGILDDSLIGDKLQIDEVGNIYDENVKRFEKEAKDEKFKNQILIPSLVLIGIGTLCALIILFIEKGSKKNGKVSRNRT